MNKIILCTILTILAFGCNERKDENSLTNSKSLYTKKVDKGIDIETTTCENFTKLLVYCDTSNQINIDSLGSIEHYFNIKAKYAEKGKVVLKIDELWLTVDCTPRKSQGGIVKGSENFRAIWRPSEYKFQTNISDSAKNQYLCKCVKKVTYDFYRFFMPDKVKQEKLKIEGPEIRFVVYKNTEIKELKTYLKSATEGYLEAIQELSEKSICGLNKEEIENIRKEKPFEIRISMENEDLK